MSSVLQLLMQTISADTLTRVVGGHCLQKLIGHKAVVAAIWTQQFEHSLCIVSADDSKWSLGTVGKPCFCCVLSLRV